MDGNDLIATHEAIGRALEKARGGGGPHLIEALTYRRADHTTADDARRYRTEEEVQRYSALDPIDRLRNYLVHKEVWSDAEEERLQAE